MPFKPPVYKRGDRPTAEQFNDANAEIGRLGQMRGGPGIEVREGVNRQIRVVLPETIIIVLTSTYSAPGYAWKEVVDPTPNTWIDSGYTGTVTDDPAIERRTGDATLTVDGVRYEATRSPTSGAWLFDGKI